MSAPMEIKPGQWVYTREWQGPFLLVKGVTAKRVTCTMNIGDDRKYLLEPHHVVAVSDSRDGVAAAEVAFRQTFATYKRTELADIKERRSALSKQQADLEREIRATAIEAAQAAAKTGATAQ